MDLKNSPELNQVLNELAEALLEALSSPQVSFVDNKIELTGGYITRKQAAAYLKVCLSTLHNYTKQGKIKTYRIGNKVLIKRSELEASIK